MPEGAENPKPPKSLADRAQDRFHRKLQSKELLTQAREERKFGDDYNDASEKHIGLFKRLMGLVKQNPDPEDPNELPLEPRV